MVEICWNQNRFCESNLDLKFKTTFGRISPISYYRHLSRVGKSENNLPSKKKGNKHFQRRYPVTHHVGCHLEDKGDKSTTWSSLLECPVLTFRSKWSTTCQAKATLKTVFTRVSHNKGIPNRNCRDMYCIGMLCSQKTRGFKEQTIETHPHGK